MLKNIQRPLYQFTVQKYFIDTKYKSIKFIYPDINAIAVDKPGKLSKICNLFAKNNINLTYLRTHCLDKRKN